LSEREVARKVVMAVTYLKHEFTEEELDKLLAKIEREDTVMPVLQPSYWIRNQENLQTLREQTVAIQTVVKTKEEEN
jgi:hypothetical protein